MAGFTAKEESFKVFESEKNLNIPLFQRKYVWKEDNWKELFESFFNNKHFGFLGSILVQRKSFDAGSGDLDVIDGQQRLTTISILIMAIYDSLDQEKKDNATDGIHNILFSKGTYEKEYSTKLNHSKFDRLDYNKIVKLNREEGLIDSNINYGIIGCYNYFKNRLKEVEKEKIEEVFDNIISGRDKIWVVITLDKEMDEQTIFDTLNNSGVSLTAGDTIKNYIFKRAHEIYDRFYSESTEEAEEKLIELYNNTWDAAFSKTQELSDYWDKIKVTGRVKRINLDLFLFSFGVVSGIFTTYENSIAELAQMYKRYINTIDSKEEMDSFLKNIYDYSLTYKNSFDCIDSETLFVYSQDNVIERLMHLNNYLEMTAFNPYILKMLKDYENDTNTLLKKLHLLEKYLVYNNLTKDTSKTKNYNKMCMTIINDPNKLENECLEIDLNNTFVFLNDITNKMARFYLFWVELYRRNENDDEPKLQDTYSLEHIMPQKWTQEWFPTGQTDINLNEFIENRNNHIGKIGNMTLLKGKLNTSISNKKFKDKIEKMRPFATLKITKEDIINAYDKGERTWDENRIDARTTVLTNDIKKIFFY